MPRKGRVTLVTSGELDTTANSGADTVAATELATGDVAARGEKRERKIAVMVSSEKGPLKTRNLLIEQTALQKKESFLRSGPRPSVQQYAAGQTAKGAAAQ